MALLRTKAEPATPLSGVDLVLADLDGVVYRGADAIEHAVASLNRTAESIRVGYVTNNASRTDAHVAAHLSELGLHVRAEDVVTSSQAAIRLLADRVPAPARILVVGGEGLREEVRKAGYEIVASADDAPAAVVQGFSPDIGWRDLAEASFALAGGEDGIPWIATNTDWTLPQERGIAPGNGTLVSAVHLAVGRLPVVAGKPEVPIFELATERFSSAAPLFVGDRLDTDILGANRAGIPTAHVLTGVDRAKQLLAAEPDQRPRYILRDLRGLHLPYPEVRVGRADAVSVGRARVAVENGRVRILSDGGDELDLLRAACAAIWKSGTPIYALQVPESLYL